MWPYPAACLRVMREVADEHDLVLVFDEIATGFGRTGTMFAAERRRRLPRHHVRRQGAHRRLPDPRRRAVHAAVARGISGSESGVLMHGPTYMGNPLACAVALANLDLLTSTDWAADRPTPLRPARRGPRPARDLPGVVDVRTLGAVGVIQLDRPVDVVAATEAALAAGVWIRPFRDLIYTMPPYICTDADIDTICTALRAAAVAG